MDKFTQDSVHLTEASDWNAYYNHRSIAAMQRCSQESSLIDEWLMKKKGSIFKLGFGGSTLLSRSAFLGWQVGGIDFNQDAVSLTKDYFQRQNVDIKELHYGNALDFGSNQIDGAMIFLFQMVFWNILLIRVFYLLNGAP
jgi:hypothetical protein